MRNSSIALLLISSSLAGPEAGATNATGFIANADCSDLTTEVDTRNAELYLLKLSATAARLRRTPERGPPDVLG